MPTMTFLEAVIKVLDEANGGALGCIEITKRAIEKGYLLTSGRTPVATMRYTLYKHMNEAKAKRQDSRLERLGSGRGKVVFRLRR